MNPLLTALIVFTICLHMPAMELGGNFVNEEEGQGTRPPLGPKRRPVSGLAALVFLRMGHGITRGQRARCLAKGTDNMGSNSKVFADRYVKDYAEIQRLRVLAEKLLEIQQYLRPIRLA